jgi:hypothetical protein
MQADDSYPWLRIEKVIGVLPALLCPGAEGRAFHLGLGSGVSASWCAAAAPGLKVEVAELVPGVAEKLGEFRPHNAAGKFEVRLGDGRSLLAAEKGEYRLIVTDIVFPEDAGAGGLFGVEYFRLAESRLAKDGLFAHWLPLWQLSPGAFRSTVRAFLEVFPEATMWAGSVDGLRPLVALVGVKGEGEARAAFNPQRISARIMAAKVDARGLTCVDMPSAAAVLGHFVAGPEKLAELAGGARASSDNLPLSELFPPTTEPGKRASLDNLDLVLKAWEPLGNCGLFEAKRWDEKTQARSGELLWARLALAEANSMLFRQGPSAAVAKMREAWGRNKTDPEAVYALWTLLYEVAMDLGGQGQYAPSRGLFEESLKIWKPLAGKTDFDPRRDYILRGLALASAQLSIGPDGKVLDGKTMKEALELAREAVSLRRSDPVNWAILARVASRAGRKEEAEEASREEARLKKLAGAPGGE